MDHPEGRGATRTSSCANEIAIGILLSRESMVYACLSTRVKKNYVEFF